MNPPETGSFKQTPGFESANGQCLTCHSVEYVQMQPLKPRDFWVAVVKPGRVLFEMEGVPEAEAREALRLASHKLPLPTRFVSRAQSV